MDNTLASAQEFRAALTSRRRPSSSPRRGFHQEKVAGRGTADGHAAVGQAQVVPAPPNRLRAFGSRFWPANPAESPLTGRADAIGTRNSGPRVPIPRGPSRNGAAAEAVLHPRLKIRTGRSDASPVTEWRNLRLFVPNRCPGSRGGRHLLVRNPTAVVCPSTGAAVPATSSRGARSGIEKAKTPLDSCTARVTRNPHTSQGLANA